MATSDPTDRIVGASPALAALRAQMHHLASFDRLGNPHVPTVLLQGETGTGKGLVAQIMHECGPRARGPFIDVNCAAIPETMLESELFGFEAGAFTDARRAKPGLFEAASGGALFLDEVDALPLPLQSKLLTAIEHKHVRRLGAVDARHVDVKLVVATQRDLQAMAASGSFRADLYHRLAVVILAVPPLRERGEDVVTLATHFLEVYAAAHRLAPKRLEPSARAWLLAYAWPGNVRELSHLMERVTLLCPGERLGGEDLARLATPLAAPATPAGPPAALATSDASPGEDEPARIRAALARSGGNVVQAARLLGIGRNALRYRMRRHGIARPRLTDAVPAPDVAVPATAPVAGASRPPRPAPDGAPRWEEKPVVVLTIEVAAASDAVAGGEYDPWGAAARWERTIVERVRGFGGVFLRAAPARLTALFGVPRTLEQLADRAVQAALAVRRLVTASPLRAGETRPDLRIAAHVGTVRFDVGAADPLATVRAFGDGFVLPERLIGHAGPGEILLSEPLARRVGAGSELTARLVRFGAAGAPITVFAVEGRRAAPSGESLAGDETALVGREPELGVLLECFRDAAGGQGQLVFVVGEAGIGKSRLLRELRRRLGGEPHRWLEGRCASYGAATAFLPIVDALRRHLAIDDRDDEPAAIAKLEGTVGALGDDLAWTLPFLARVLSLGVGDSAVAALDSASRRSETFRALKALVLRLAAQEPLVFVVEDLHWIDPASEELLVFLAEAIPTSRALLVCSHRPGYAQPFGDRSYHVRISVRPLSGAETAAMTGSLLGVVSLPPPLADLIARKAEGNPFFVEEVTRSLVEDGTLAAGPAGLVLARDVADLAVPDSIHDVLSARLDRLPDEGRQALQIAAVIGREFALRLLARIADAGERVSAVVSELRTLELVYEKAAHPELAYMFKHALTHDVAYASVVAERRARLHRTIGLAIEELYADRLAEHYETLAHHFSCGEDWPRALAYHERAIEKAAGAYANRAVVEHCRAAVAIAERLGGAVAPERRAGLEEQLALASFYVSEYAESGAAYERAAGHATEPPVVSVRLALAAQSRFWAHEYAPARAAIAGALAAAEGGADAHAGRALATAMRGFIGGVTEGDMAGYRREAEAALTLALASGSESAIAAVRFALAQLAEWTGDYARAIELAEQARVAGRAVGLAHLFIWPTWFLGKASCCLGMYDRALAELGEAAALCDRIGDRAWKSRMLNTLGWCYAEIGAQTRARACNEEGAVIARELGDPEILANSEINLALNHLGAGRVDEARAGLTPVRAQLAAPGDPWMRWRYALHVLDASARLDLACGEPAAALAAAEEEITQAARRQAVKVEARARVLKGRALLALERRDEAGTAAHEALGVAERIGYPRAVLDALALASTVAARAGRRADAAAHAARGRALAERLARSLADAELRGALLAPT